MGLKTKELYRILTTPTAWLVLTAFSFMLVACSGNSRLKELPEFSYPYADQGEFWINSPPIKKRSLAGKVVLVDFWTFGCIYCRESVPWLNHLENTFPSSKFAVIGIHSPELNHEKNREEVKRQIKTLKITHPVMTDNEHIFFREAGISVWPTFLLIDQESRIRGEYLGRILKDSERATQIEQEISLLINS